MTASTVDYTPEQLAELLGISVDTVYRNIRNNTWPHQRYSARQRRFTREQIQQIREMCAVDPTVNAQPGAQFDRVTRGKRSA